MDSKPLPVSIVIPTFNEEKYLFRLLKSIKSQTKQPQEIIVADAYSLDRTREVARAFGCKVISGGLPSKARNNGVRAAKAKVILFLDADVILPQRFLEQTFEEMQERNLDIASCFVRPLSNAKIDSVIHEFANYYIKLTRPFYPHIPGCCIYVKKSLHKKIGGFDESLLLAEDHDYLSRAKNYGKFSYLKSYKIPISIRKFTKEGRLKLALKYITIELHLILIGQIRKDIFSYFGDKHVPNMPRN